MTDSTKTGWMSNTINGRDPIRDLEILCDTFMNALNDFEDKNEIDSSSISGACGDIEYMLDEVRNELMDREEEDNV